HLVEAGRAVPGEEGPCPPPRDRVPAIGGEHGARYADPCGPHLRGGFGDPGSAHRFLGQGDLRAVAAPAVLPRLVQMDGFDHVRGCRSVETGTMRVLSVFTNTLYTR